jgi:hypothetical protein
VEEGQRYIQRRERGREREYIRKGERKMNIEIPMD